MMTRKSLRWRGALIAIVVAGAFYYAYPPLDPDGAGPREGKIKLGLDLRGGMDVTLRVDTSKLPASQKEDATVRALEIIRNRVDQFGVSEPNIQRQGLDRINVQLPGITDRDRALELIGKTALLQFKLVSDDTALFNQAVAGTVPDGYVLAKDEESKQLLLQKEATLTGVHIKDASVSFGQYNEAVVHLELDAEGGQLFSDITGANVNRRLAIVLDDVVQSAPVINERIPSGSAQITGRFSFEEANDLAIALRAGALPCPIVVEEERSVGAHLGKDSVEKGVRAALIGFAIVVAFMTIYYKVGGIVANIALLLNILITLACLAKFGATLTLPGIAGIVLTIGMAVDTNVLIFERIREELALKKPLSTSMTAGYNKAFSTILDANLTTLITAIILYIMGTGPIKGFALTLSIGIIASMFTGILVTRVIFEIIIQRGWIKDLRFFQFFKKIPSVNYLKYRKACYALSLIIILVGIGAFVKRGETMYGVDFSGGVLQEFAFEKTLSIEDVRKSLQERELGTAIIQRVGETNHIIVRTPLGTEKIVSEQIKASFPDNPYEIQRIESVGPIVGKELKTKALWALILSLVAICVYVGLRFDFRFAFGALLAIFHDAAVALGMVALTGREVSVTVLAAVLTILGFSINDTIVIFDRIRERRRSGIKESFEDAINISVNQTMSRTILTTLMVLIVVTSLYFYGGDVINDFAFTLLVGLISGTYSTIYIAAPVLVDWPGKKR